MKEYYVHQTEAESDACLQAINQSGWFPLVGKVNGVDAPHNAITICWIEKGIQMITGEWAIPRIPEERLDTIGVSQEARNSFLAIYGQDIRELDHSDFPAPIEV